MPSRRRPPAVPGATLVRLLAHLVPRDDRNRWRDEWWGELAWAWDHPRTELPTPVHRAVHWLALVGRAMGAVPDALEMRRTYGGDPMLAQLGHDLRLALRALGRRRAYAALVALTLALGIGATTAVFTVVDTVLLRPLPFREPDALVELSVRTEDGDTYPYLAPTVVDAWQAQRGVLDQVARYTNLRLVLEDGEPENVRAVPVSPEFFPLLGVAPRLGRTIVAEDVATDARVAVVSEALWRSALGSDPDAVGRTITLSGERYTVIGVMPPTFRYPKGEVAMWLPLSARLVTSAPDEPPVRVGAVGRLAVGASLAMAQERADALAPQLAAERPDVRNWGLALQALGEWRANPDMRRALLVLAGAVACVLLIACANAANLLLVRASASRRDLVVRLALGATRGRLVRELLAETGLLALAGGALGVLAAHAGVQAIVALAPRELLFWSFGPAAIDTRVMGFAVALTVATMLLVGLLPAFQATGGVAGRRRGHGAALIVAERAGTGTREQHRVRRALVVGQLALSVMLLVGAGLLISSFARLSRVEPGMRLENLALLDVMPSDTRYASRAERAAFYEAVAERMRAIPGVEAVSVLAGVAGGGGGFHFGTALEVEGAGGPAGGDPELLPFGEADTSYFRALGIPIRQGRAFEAADLEKDANTVIIDEDLARHLWPDGRAVGQRFRVREKGPWLTVVGVAGDVKLEGPDDRKHPFELYYPTPLGAGFMRTFAVRTSSDPSALLLRLKAAVHAVDSKQPVAAATTAEERYGRPLVKPRFFVTLMAVFAGVAVTLAAVGLYGVIAYAVTQRTREIGVRMALGARREQIVGGVLREGMVLAAVGMALGLAGALALGRVIESLLFGVAPNDPLTLGVVVVLLGTLTVLAAYVPARWASRVDPVIAMRTE